MLDTIQNQLVLLRTDLNLPLKNGEIADKTRLKNALPTIEKLLEQGCGVAICSHLGRPNGQVKSECSLKPVATALAHALGRAVEFLPDCTADKGLELGEVILLENTRFYAEEKTNDANFAAKLADGCDIFVMDAFGTAHRQHASTVGVAQILPSQMGILLHKELTILQGILHQPPRPLVVLVGGAKLTTKIGVLKNVVKFADTVLLGGGIANTFLKYTKQMEVEGSLYEEGAGDLVGEIMQLAQANNCAIVLPSDAHRKDNVILDLGEKSIAKYCEQIKSAATFVWNGPVGKFEDQEFATGTLAIAHAAAENIGQTIVGGGDTLLAIKQAKLSIHEFTHLSTGGGAMLKVLEGAELPAVKALS